MSQADIVYLKTNFLMVVGKYDYGSFRFVTPNSASNKIIDTTQHNVILPVTISMHQESLATISPLMLQHLINRDGLGAKLKELSTKSGFLLTALSQEELKKIDAPEDALIWGENLRQTYNVVSGAEDNLEIAIRGDFETLGNAMMVAHMNGGGYVTVNFDPKTLTSKIGYEMPKIQRHARPKLQKLSLVAPK